jgi:hypothetical protein
MLSLVGGFLAVCYCLFATLFRWDALKARYGTLSLHWWVVAVITAGTFFGFAIDVAIWGVQYAFWLASS